MEFNTFKSRIPSFHELDLSLRDPNPPLRVNSLDPSDLDLLSKLRMQTNLVLVNNTYNNKPYNSSAWPNQMVLNLSLRNRVIELAEQSGKMGKSGYEFKEYTKGDLKGERRVCFNGRTVIADRLLSIIG